MSIPTTNVSNLICKIFSFCVRFIYDASNILVLCLSCLNQHISILLRGVLFFKVHLFSLQECSFIEYMSQVFKNGLSLKISMDMLSIKNYALLFTKDNGLYFSWYKNSLIITVFY